MTPAKNLTLCGPSRPIVRWHGGKWRLAPWVISHFPPHRIYVEPYGGGASVLLRKDRSYAEVYNDLDEEIVNLFRIARDQGDELIRRLELTPFSRVEFQASYAAASDPMERARQTVIKAYMGFGSSSITRVSGFRNSCTRSGTTPAHDWARYPDALRATVARLQGVVIENRDAVNVMDQHDGPETLHYVDPPYLPETRNPGHDYAHELTQEDHEALLERLTTLRGMVVLSGYPSAKYDDALKGWTRLEKASMADGARPRTEVLWLSPNIETVRLT